MHEPRPQGECGKRRMAGKRAMGATGVGRLGFLR